MVQFRRVKAGDAGLHDRFAAGYEVPNHVRQMWAATSSICSVTAT